MLKILYNLQIRLSTYLGFFKRWDIGILLHIVYTQYAFIYTTVVSDLYLLIFIEAIY